MARLLICSAFLGLFAAATDVTYLAGDPARFSYVDMPTPLSGPCDVSQGPDGLVYVQELLANKIVRYNQHTGDITEYDIPFTLPLLPNATLPLPGNAKAELLTCAIRNGFDGKMYFSNGNRNQLVRHDTSTGETVVFTPPGLLQAVANLEPLNDLTTAPDGVYFTQTTGNAVVKFDYATHEFTTFPLPTELAVPLGIYYASDGAVWFLELAANKVGRLNRTTGAIEEFDIPLSGALPVVMRAETHNDKGECLLWFASVLGGGVGSINEATHEILFYPENIASNAVEDAQDYAGNVWVSHVAQNTLGVFNPTFRNYTEVVMPGTVIPAPVSVPLYGGSGIYCKPVGNPFAQEGAIGNAIWFTQLTLNRLVRFDLNGLVF